MVTYGLKDEATKTNSNLPSKTGITNEIEELKPTENWREQGKSVIHTLDTIENHLIKVSLALDGTGLTLAGMRRVLDFMKKRL